jgi:hypothetical protein
MLPVQFCGRVYKLHAGRRRAGEERKRRYVELLRETLRTTGATLIRQWFLVKLIFVGHADDSDDALLPPVPRHCGSPQTVDPAPFSLRCFD